MLSLNEIKNLSEEPEMSNEEAERLRSVCYGLARLALEVWRNKNKKEIKSGGGTAAGEIKTPCKNKSKQGELLLTSAVVD